MENFADQCLDMAQSILGHNLESISEQGTISPITGEASRQDEPGHAALAIGEYYRVTNETQLGDYDLVDLAARCVTAQAFSEEEHEYGLAYMALGLCLNNRIAIRSGSACSTRRATGQVCSNTATTKTISRASTSPRLSHASVWVSPKRTKQITSSTASLKHRVQVIRRLFCDSTSGAGKLGGAFDVYGDELCLHSPALLLLNLHLRERKLPSLRTHAEKYLKLIPDLARQDGTAFACGRSIGAYGQMHCISLALQALRDGWINSATSTPMPFAACS